jgi:tetratricopeptide (TPR) repeat protein
MDLPKPQINEALDRLINAGLVFARSTPPETSYLFKHALVQDAAYSSLLRGRRRELHRRIAAAVEERFPEIAQAQPALLALHCQEAGLTEQAVGYRLKAGQQALARSAMIEAEAQLRGGLEVLLNLSDSRRRQELELDLYIAFGVAIAAIKGYSEPEVVRVLARTLALAEQIGKRDQLILALDARFWSHYFHAEYNTALALAERFADFGASQGDDVLRSHGDLLCGIIHYVLGHFEIAILLLQQYLDSSRISYGMDIKNDLVQHLSVRRRGVGFVYLGMILACLGHIDQAQSWISKAVFEGHQSERAYALVYARLCENWVKWIIGSHTFDTAEALALSNIHHFSFFRGWLLAFQGWSRVKSGEAEEGLALLMQAQAILRTIEAGVFMPVLFSWLAHAHAALGQADESQCCLLAALRLTEATGERLFEAELLHTLPGNLLAAAGDLPGAERHYRQAIAVAERQSTRLFQLRASVSLARLWRDQGRRAEAHDLLASIYGWFTEGFDTPVLKKARALLDELA